MIENPPRPAVHDPALAAVERLADRTELARLLDTLPWLDGADGARAAVRLRWKPGTNLRIGAVVPTAAGPAAVLMAVFAPHSRGKAGRIAGHAVSHDAPVYRDGGIVAVPGPFDPHLDGLVPPTGVPLAYNPARRWVGRDGACVVKVHAVAPPSGVAALLAAPSSALAAHLPPVEQDHGGRLVRSAWIPGSPPGPADLPAVMSALDVLHACPPPMGLPVVDAASAVRAADIAAQAVAAALPGESARVRALVAVLHEHAYRWPTPTSLVHGDFSPDQVLVRAEGAVLLDLDRAALGPPGWDWAQWTVAQIAHGGVVVPAPRPAEPVLALAAALQRAPEPFRRLRPGWPRLVEDVLSHAEAAAAEVRRLT
ncbi:phosphotransferase family protein [Nonomuraea polychroma]|uniref:phosphotransferase family protein n=1 Tax=Nonomuraea polychroma TaxID=46176 RepID=UPI003D8B79DD